MADEEERKIPVFTVTKNGAILKNIFVVNNPPSPPSVSDTHSEKEYGDEEEILTVGRHPDCHIMLTHPSISRFHLQIHSKPSSQKLSVIDLSSVHGTWVSEKKLEPRVPVELNEGDTIRVGGSTRMYRLHWVPLSQSYDMENPFVSRLDVSMAESKEVEDRLLEEEDDFETNQDENSVSIENGKIEVNGSLERKEEQTCQDPNSWSIEMKHTEMEDLLVKERKEEGTYQDDNSMAVQNKALQSLDSILDGIVSLFSDGNCFLSSGIESVDLSVPVREAMSESMEQQFDKDDQVPWHYPMTEVVSEKENPDIFSRSEEQSELLANLFASPSVAEEVKLLEEFKDESLLQEDDEMRDNSKLWSESLMKEPVYPSLALGEVLSEIKTEQVDEENETLVLTGLQPLSENENKENLPVDQNLDLVVNLNTACFVEDGCPAAEVFEEADQTLSRKDHEEQEIACFGTVLEAESVNSSLPVGEVFTEFNDDKESQTPESFYAPAGLYEPENLDSSSTPCFVEDGCPAADVFEDADQTLSRKDHEEHEIPSFGTDLEAESVNSSLPVGEVFTEFNDGKESQTQQSFYAPAGLYEPENLDSSPTRSDKKPSLNNIWSRRGKPASVLQIQTGRSGGKTIRDHDSAEVEFQDFGDIENKSISRVLFSGLDDMEEEPYTPNKENYSPNTLLLKSLKRKGKLEEIKHSRSKVAFSPNVQLEEDLSFFSDKENQTPKVLLEQKKPTRHASRNQVKLEQERLAMKKRTERVPFHSLIENSASKSRSQSSSVATTSNHSVNYTQPVEKVTNSSSTVGEGRRSWTMIVDAAATLLDKESRKSLQLLQGLKGTQLIIPRIVIRELDCLKRRGGLFRRTTEISSVLEWIEECMVKTEWWINIQSSAEELMPIGPTPPASPQSRFSDGSTSWGPFSSYTSLTEIVSPTAEDHILDYGLLYRKMNGGQLVLLSNDVTLKIKAMSEGLICETAQEFRESLVNPFSERFLWAESSPRGLTWSHLDDDVLRERYNHCPLKKKPSKGGDGAKGLKLILLHNSSHYGQIR
ncbi:hypothetical protein EZV62_022317 [Acer yangbiense]|uniref:FHA domain-containing protein n=1 Tax=Acer yangbiense TaxID=1000413 RepID=A0A5C7H7X4_9ROSI|nr:hypothetical protein EZV62_022317 [Acer yangbiense]